MTISTTDSRISYNGNGVTTVFSFPYRFLANGDLVVVSVSSTGVETVKTLTTDYTLTGAGDDAGGSVTMLVAPASGTRLVIYRDTDITQETDYISGDPFPAETHERALDRLTMIAQEIGSDADRSIKVPVGDSSSLSTVLPAAANRLDKFIVFDASTGETEVSTITQTQVASAVAAAYAAGSTADAVTFLQAGSGAVSRSVQAKLREMVSVADFGTLGAGNDAAILQAAINAVQGTNVGLYIPTYVTLALGGTGVTVTGKLRLVGIGGRDSCTISWTGTTMYAITVTSSGAFQCEGISFSGPAAASDGGAISLSGSGGVANSFSKIRDCTFIYGHKTIYAPDAYAWDISGNYFTGAILNGIYVGCTTDVDAGDSAIHSNTFANLGASCAAINQVSSGGLRIYDNKFNGGAYGYYMDLATSAVTSILMISDNSFENQTNSGISLLHSGGGGTFTHAMIVDNMFANQPKAINLGSSGSWLSLVTISGNSISGTAAGSTALITLTNAPRSVIKGNNLNGVGTATVGITVGSGSTSCEIGPNLIAGCVTDVTNAATNSIASANALVIPSGIDVVQITGNTQINSINLANSEKGRRIELMFTGAPTVKHATSNIKLSGSADFVASANDTLRLTCFDGTNWSETGRTVI